MYTMMGLNSYLLLKIVGFSMQLVYDTDNIIITCFYLETCEVNSCLKETVKKKKV